MKRFSYTIILATVALGIVAAFFAPSPTAYAKNPSNCPSPAQVRVQYNEIYANPNAGDIADRAIAVKQLKQGLADKGCTYDDAVFSITTDTSPRDKACNVSNAEGISEIKGIVDPAVCGDPVCSKKSCSVVGSLINPLIFTLTMLVGLAVAAGIIIGGIQVATSAGDPQKAASGKDHIRNAVIAAVAYALLFALIRFILPGGF